mmetsp:Transcript_47309/g.111571  ORF Transcript_47309/g.111571 Transcript_47309/m.111571 type:complete len:205 (+) Transcript_47309:211-825(+)
MGTPFRLQMGAGDPVLGLMQQAQRPLTAEEIQIRLQLQLQGTPGGLPPAQLGLLAEHMRPFNPNIPAQVEEPDSLVASAGNLTQGFSATYTDPRFGDSSSSQNPFSSSFDDISRAGAQSQNPWGLVHQQQAAAWGPPQGNYPAQQAHPGMVDMRGNMQASAMQPPRHPYIPAARVAPRGSKDSSLQGYDDAWEEGCVGPGDPNA